MSASDDNRLTTTGQVDWTSLSRSTITMSLDVAARFANAGVDAITVGVGRALGSWFSSPPRGTARAHVIAEPNERRVVLL